MKLYERYNWIGQAERLIYIGKKGSWHQFVKVDARDTVWCEVLDSDLHMIEETQSAQPTPSQSVVDEPYAYEAVYENKTCVLIYDDGELDPDNVEVWGSYELNPLYRRAQLNTKPTNNDAIDAGLIQILTDPENQPSQYGTVPLAWYENLENKLDRIRFNVEQVIDSLDTSYEKHAIRKQLQEAINSAMKEVK